MKEIISEYGELGLAAAVAMSVLALVGILLEGPFLQEIIAMTTVAF